MRRFIRAMLRIKTRFYVAATVILLSVAVTPAACRSAYQFRGYFALGGEAMIIPAGLVLAYLICSVSNDYDQIQKRGKRK